MMKNYKIIFVIGYKSIDDIYNDNIDVNIVFETGEVYFGTLVTIKNIQTFFNRGDSYFWSTDMLILENLRKESIMNAIEEIIKNESYFYIFDKIGELYEDQFLWATYEELVHMNDETCSK